MGGKKGNKDHSAKGKGKGKDITTKDEKTDDRGKGAHKLKGAKKLEIRHILVYYEMPGLCGLGR